MSKPIGMLWVWGEPSKARDKHLTPRLKQSGVNFQYINYIKGAIPSLNMNPATDVVFGLGGNPTGSPLQELKNFGLVKKNLTLGSSRGKVYTLPSGTPCLTSYTASVRDIQYDMFIDLESDLQLAIRYLTYRTLVPPLLDFQWVYDLTEVLRVIQEHHTKWVTKPIDVALDLETTGLVAYDPDTWIITLQVSTDEESSRVIKFDQDFQPRKPLGITPTCREELLWIQISQLLNDPLISLKGANLKYDLGWIARKWSILCTNFKFDTLLVGSILDENRSNSLKTHAFIYTPYGGYESEIYEKYDIAKAHEIPPDILLPYCGYDTAVCLQVARKQKEELLRPENRNLLKFYVNILHPAARAYERVERTGVLVDLDYYNGFKKELEDKLAINLIAAHKILGGKILTKFKKKDDENSISLSRAAMIADFMFGKRWLNLKPVMFTPKSTDEKPMPSTALEHFLKFKDDPIAGPFVKVLQEYKDIAKTLSTYIDGFLACLRDDQRFHATFFLFKGQEGQADEAGTNTGRISIKDPALQTIPKKTKWAKPLRRAFIAPKGYYILSADYSQGELRIAADFAGEEAMIMAYNKGIDLHAFTGAGLAGIDFETFMTYKDNEDPYKAKIYEVNRQSAKAANFGLLYGMSADGYRTYAETSYGLKMTATEAEEARNKFFDTYPALLPWHERTKKLAMQQGYIDSPLGRRRHLPLLNSPDRQTASKELRRSVNAAVQGTLSDFSLWATAILDKEGITEEAPAVLMVHDQLIAYLPEDNWEFYAKRYRDVMENLPVQDFGWNPRVKFEVDVEISVGDPEKGIPPNLANLVKPKKLSPTW